jgi:5'-nucleotidase
MADTTEAALLALDSFRIDLNNRIFVNRTLNMNGIKVVGFDMDYTLVLYKEAELEALAFRFAIDELVERQGYPEWLRSLQFSQERIIRGLVIDKRLGNLLKVNRFGYIKAALHGDRFYTLEEQKALYSNEIVTFTNPRFEMVHTMFSLASCSLFCQLVDRPELGKSYEDLYSEISGAVDYVHRSGVLKKRIMADPERFVILDPMYAETLRMFRASRKKLVLITNSEWEFTQAMMSHSYDRYLPAGETWRSLFNVVIVDASKPSFFTDSHRFYEVLTESGHLRNVHASIAEGRVYQAGNAADIEALFGVNGSEVLYVGDHIYSDVLQSKKSMRWRTMLVITELEEELKAAAAGKEHLEAIRAMMVDKERLELQVAQLSKRRLTGFSLLPSLQGLGEPELSALQGAIRERIAAIDVETRALIDRYNAGFNPHWGELLWAGNDKSHFAMVIERFACTYGSKVSNLLYYSPGHYFRPPIKGLS